MKIYIDQGHNPENPNSGAEGNGYREQDLVYEIGQQTAARLRGMGFDVRLSRPTAQTQLGTSVATSLAALRITEATGLEDRGVFARPGLYVLRKTRMPAVLVELGFITNRRDAELMAYSPGLFAAGIANGLMTYLRSI